MYLALPRLASVHPKHGTHDARAHDGKGQQTTMLRHATTFTPRSYWGEWVSQDPNLGP